MRHSLGRKLGHVVNFFIRMMHPQLMQPVDHNRAPDPDHGRRADNHQKFHQSRHEFHNPPPQSTGHGKLSDTRQPQAEVIGFDDQGDAAIDHDRDDNPGKPQGPRLKPDRLIGVECGQNNGHDLRRENEICLHRPRDLLFFEVGRIALLRHMPVRMWRVGFEQVINLFGPFKTKVGSAQHQQRRDKPRRKAGQKQRERQQDHQLVANRAKRDLAHDRQFPRRRETVDIFRCHSRIVNHRARGLGRCLGRLPCNIIHIGRRHFRNPCHVVQKRQKATHPVVPT